jgi:hypothetical protein
MLRGPVEGQVAAKSRPSRGRGVQIAHHPTKRHIRRRCQTNNGGAQCYRKAYRVHELLQAHDLAGSTIGRASNHLQGPADVRQPAACCCLQMTLHAASLSTPSSTQRWCQTHHANHHTNFFLALFPRTTNLFRISSRLPCCVCGGISFPGVIRLHIASPKAASPLDALVAVTPRKLIRCGCPANSQVSAHEQ